MHTFIRTLSDSSFESGVGSLTLPATSVCWASTPQCSVPDSRWHSVECKPCSALLMSCAERGSHPCWEWLTSVLSMAPIHPRMAKCKCSILFSVSVAHDHMCPRMAKYRQTQCPVLGQDICAGVNGPREAIAAATSILANFCGRSSSTKD